MATPFEKVYNSFYPLIKDDTFTSFAEVDETAFYDEMFQLLNNAIVNYPPISDVDLYDFDRDMEEFNTDLQPYEISILAKLMVIEYLTPLILDETLTKQTLNSKDYRSYSPAKHLESLQKIKNELNSEINRALSRQSYNPKNLEKLFGKKK